MKKITIFGLIILLLVNVVFAETSNGQIRVVIPPENVEKVHDAVVAGLALRITNLNRQISNENDAQLRSNFQTELTRLQQLQTNLESPPGIGATTTPPLTVPYFDWVIPGTGGDTVYNAYALPLTPTEFNDIQGSIPPDLVTYQRYVSDTGALTPAVQQGDTPRTYPPQWIDYTKDVLKEEVDAGLNPCGVGAGRGCRSPYTDPSKYQASTTDEEGDTGTGVASVPEGEEDIWGDDSGSEPECPPGTCCYGV